MSLLTDTQGAPERIYSLLRLLAAHDGSMARGDVHLWLDPPFDDRERAASAVDQTIRAAASLDSIDNGDTVRLLWTAEDIESYSAFADRVHDRLIGIDAKDADYLLLDVYAWLLQALDDDEGVLDLDPKAFADRANAGRGRATGSQSDLQINDTKYPHWRRWMILLGLGVELPESPRPRFFAYAATRLARELERSSLPRDTELAPDHVFAAISTRMPYLDGGSLSLALPPAGKRPSQGRLSRIFSRALVDLHDDGLVRIVRRGDARDLVHLQVRNHAVQSIGTIVLPGAAA